MWRLPDLGLDGDQWLPEEDTLIAIRLVLGIDVTPRTLRAIGSTLGFRRGIRKFEYQAGPTMTGVRSAFWPDIPRGYNSTAEIAADFPGQTISKISEWAAGRPSTKRILVGWRTQLFVNRKEYAAWYAQYVCRPRVRKEQDDWRWRKRKIDIRRKPDGQEKK